MLPYLDRDRDASPLVGADRIASDVAGSRGTEFSIGTRDLIILFGRVSSCVDAIDRVVQPLLFVVAKQVNRTPSRHATNCVY
ncbi:hypothetical protein AC630_01855 [Bradyrhizobium sp. AS23.2]|nr:hypothetical protein AC630_01855 [Bradyrhizobium sp. AS23.2]